MKTLIVTIDYFTFALDFESHEQAAHTIAALSGLRKIESEGYGSERRWHFDGDYAVEMKFLDPLKLVPRPSPDPELSAETIVQAAPIEDVPL